MEPVLQFEAAADWPAIQQAEHHREGRPAELWRQYKVVKSWIADESRTQRNEQSLQTLGHVLNRAWPVDRKPVFRSLVQALNKFDREQRRRRKDFDAGPLR